MTDNKQISTENKTHIGKVLDAHGIKGDIYCIVFSGDVSWITKIKSLNLKNQLSDQTFEILKIKAFKKGFIATLNGFSNRNKAEEYKGFEIWVETTLFTSKNGEAIYLNELLNFNVEDKIIGEIGYVRSFSSNGLQDLLEISNKGKTFPIPFVKDFILKIDFENKKIHTQLPEGLLEINEPESNE